MNFLNFLTAGASLFNFNLQNVTSSNKNQTLSPETQKIPAQGSFNALSQLQDASSSQNNSQLRSEAFSQQQQLINQYMHMNLQLLNQKLETLQKQNSQQKIKEFKQEKSEQSERKCPKKTKKINKCGHEDKQHYAKGMCNNCYHRYGRTKKPWNCPHQKLYAAGMCQNCYINNYNRKKRESNQNKEQVSEIEPKIQEQFSEEDVKLKKVEENDS